MPQSIVMRRLALIMPIRDTNRFVRKVNEAVAVFQKVVDRLKGEAGIREHDFDIRSLFSPGRAWFDMTNDQHLKELGWSFRDMAEMGASQWEGWLSAYVRTMNQAIGLMAKNEKSAGWAAKLQNLERKAEDESVLWNPDYEEGIPPHVLNLVSEYARAYMTLLHTLGMWSARAEAMVTKDVKPGKVETLYHASANAVSIGSKGFDRKVPDEYEGMGLGGSQVDKAGNRAISMTYDLRAALGISKTFKELAMVAQGKVKPTQILEWIRREGDPARFRSFLDTEWRSYEFKVEFEGGRWQVYKLEWDPGTQGHVRKPVSPDKVFSNTKDRVKLYKAYLSTTPGRFNPFFMHMYRTALYLAKNAHGIGVVVAEVNMEHPNVLHLPAEKEYRVPPDAVIRIKKVIR